MTLYVYQEVILSDKQSKGYVFRIYSNKNQKRLIYKIFGVNRLFYDYFLEEK